MEPVSIASITLIIINVLVSYKGFNDVGYLNEYAFDVDQILIYKDYKRLITSGFLHVSWTHLLFNMITLYAFSYGIESVVGIGNFLIIYFGSLLGGNLLSLFIHRHHGDYSSVGASGAVTGIIFGSIALFPGMEIGFFGLPLHLPSWLYGILYVLYSIYSLESKKDNIGHGAHLGGGFTGLIITVMMYPNVLKINYIPILLIAAPVLLFIYIIITRPEYLIIGNIPRSDGGYKTFEDKFNQSKLQKEKELDQLLDKISRKGIEGLTAEEGKRLKELSQND